MVGFPKAFLAIVMLLVADYLSMWVQVITNYPSELQFFGFLTCKGKEKCL